MSIKFLPILVGLLLSAFNFLEKIAISKYGISFQESAAIKFTTATIVILVIFFINYSGKDSLLLTGDKFGYICLVMSGILNALAILAFFYCLKFLDVSFVSTVCNTTAIIAITILGAVFLKEHLDPIRIIGILFCLVGIFLITHKGVNP